jgi:hypothetical protein
MEPANPERLFQCFKGLALWQGHSGIIFDAMILGTEEAKCTDFADEFSPPRPNFGEPSIPGAFME